MNDTIGQRISQCRKHAELSQEALGEKLGVSRQAVSKWEADAVIPEIDKLIGLSRLFDVSVGWLLGVEEPAPAAEDPALTRIEALLSEHPRQSKWLKPVLFLTALCAIISLCLSLYSLHRQAQWIEQFQTSEVLVDQIQSHYGTSLKGTFVQIEPWEDWKGAELTFTLTPKDFGQGDTARVNAISGGKIVETAECTYAQGFWTAQLSLPCATDYLFGFSLTKGDGTEHHEDLYGGQRTDLERQLAYAVSAGCESAAIRPGYFSLFQLSLDVLLPPVMQDRTPVPQWEQLDLVFFRNGEEFFRNNYRYAAPSGDLNYTSHGISAPIDDLEPDDKITVHIQAQAENGPKLDQLVFAWQILEDDTVQQIYKD